MLTDGNMIKDSVNVTQQIQGSIQIISFSGILEYQNIQFAKDRINDLFVEAKQYILDFSNLTKIDSTGFGLIFSVIKKKPVNAGLVAVVTDKFIAELFNITKIVQLFPVVGSIDKAKAILDNMGNIDDEQKLRDFVNI